MFTKRTIPWFKFWVTSHNRLSDFYASSWQRGDSPVPLLVIRLILASLSVGIVAWSLVNPGPTYLIYLTNWGLLMMCMTTLSGLLVSCLAVYTKLPAVGETPWYIALYWLIFNVACTIAFAITVLYWTLLYPDIEHLTAAIFWLDVAVHGFNSIIIMAELMLSRTPVSWFHVYQPLVVGMIYVSFSGIYFAAGGTNALGQPFIYPVLDWRLPSEAGAVAGGSLVGVFLVYAIIWAFALARNKLSQVLLRPKNRDLSQPHHQIA